MGRWGTVLSTFCSQDSRILSISDSHMKIEEIIMLPDQGRHSDKQTVEQQTHAKALVSRKHIESISKQK
uniref:Uncharacterized protein n=1 Tax=Rhizophora mucronata TaxID=61149 RepID=A0A2P2LFG7_RHIMU